VTENNMEVQFDPQYGAEVPFLSVSYIKYPRQQIVCCSLPAAILLVVLTGS
jgi:hypothetical protein